MKKRIIIAAAFTACLALCAAVSSQSTTVEKTPTPDPKPTVTASQPMLPEPEKLGMTVITEKETAKASETEPAPEVTADEPPVSVPETERQPEAEQEPMSPTKPEQDPALAPPTEPELEVSNNSSEDMVYVPGFNWIESQGPNHVEYAEDMYENGNKIGIMG